MAKTNGTKREASKTQFDSVYLLKIVLYVILGAQWLWLDSASGTRVPIPVGLIIGLLFAMHDHFRLDRKIEYAVLLVAMLVGYVATIGIVIQT